MEKKVLQLVIFSFCTLVVSSPGSSGPTSSAFCGRVLSISDNTKVYNLTESGDTLFCNYEFKANAAEQVKLNFTENDLGATNHLLDYVVLFDGVDCLAKRIGVVHKWNTPVYISSSNRMTAVLIKHRVRASFKGTYAAVTGQDASIQKAPFPDNQILSNCGREVTERRGNVSFRGDGAHNALCIWRFRTEPGKRVHLQLQYVQLIYDGSWVRILDGGDCAAPELMFKTDSRISLPYNVNSTSNELTLLFASGIGSPEEGIEASFSDGESTDLSPTTSTPTTATEVGRSIGTDIPEYVNSLATRHTFEVLTAVFVHSTYYFIWITMA